MNVWMVPLPQSNVVATNFMQAKGNAGFRGEMITAGCRPIKITSVGAPWQVLGYRNLNEYEVAGGTIGAIGSNPANSAAITCWQVSYATMDGSAVVGQVYFDFELEANVDLFAPTEELV